MLVLEVTAHRCHKCARMLIQVQAHSTKRKRCLIACSRKPNRTPRTRQCTLLCSYAPFTLVSEVRVPPMIVMTTASLVKWSLAQPSSCLTSQREHGLNKLQCHMRAERLLLTCCSMDE